MNKKDMRDFVFSHIFFIVKVNLLSNLFQYSHHL